MKNLILNAKTLSRKEMALVTGGVQQSVCSTCNINGVDLYTKTFDSWADAKNSCTTLMSLTTNFNPSQSSINTSSGCCGCYYA